MLGVDTGTFMSAVFVGISPEPYEAVALVEVPNYRYVAGDYELLGATIPEWAAEVTRWWDRFSLQQGRPGRRCHGWCDSNSQFKTELTHYGISLHGNGRGDELRCEIAREYFQHNKIRLAPWLDVLPYELENASFPPEETGGGKYRRLKEKDHTLDCLEHCLSRRPRSKRIQRQERPTLVQQHLARHANPLRNRRQDIHLGRL